MKDSKRVRLSESERHHLEASKTAATPEKWLWIRQACLYDKKKKKKKT